jgi:AcrR family transcriptional regulator
MATPPKTRPRSQRAHQAILAAALELCIERGFAKTSVDAIAQRAGVGKQTIYRWWPSKAAVVVEAVHKATASTVAFPDTGDVVADLRAQMTDVAHFFQTDVVSLYREVIGAAQSDAAAAQTILETLIGPRVEECLGRLQKAQKDGQIKGGIDLEDVVDILYAPLYYRLLLGTRPVTPGQVEDVLELVFDGLRPPRHTGSRRKRAPKTDPPE